MRDPADSPSEIVPSDLAGTRAVVAGLGVTGRSVAAALRARGAVVVTVDDAAPEADLHGPEGVDWAATDVVVVSPGWPPSHPLLVAARGAGVPVWSEVELAWRLRVDRAGDRGPAPWLVVTGTNGKTTTVGMLASILAAAGLRTAAVGNVGTPVVEAAVDPALDVLAVELSSFQLHHTSSLRAHAAACLNVAPDHIDWHGSFEAYAADKGRVFTGAEVACVYSVEDPVTERLVREADVAEGARAVGVTRGVPGLGQLGVVEDILCDRAFAADRHTHAQEIGTTADLAHLAGPGGVVPPHVVTNALFAAALALSVDLPPAAVRQGLRDYVAGAHRMALAGEVAGVRYVDDSKATNAHAADAALRAMTPGTVVWVAGGLAKGASYDALVAAHAHRLRAVVLIGVDRTDLRAALARHAPAIPVNEVDGGDTGTVMTRAVDLASRLARPGDTVLLAPASASMDQFASYAARGRAFADAVRALAGGVR